MGPILACRYTPSQNGMGLRCNPDSIPAVKNPRVVDNCDDVTIKAIAGGAAGIVAALLGGYTGGLLGEQYHRQIDAAVATAATPNTHV